jgi:hypothetical protein
MWIKLIWLRIRTSVCCERDFGFHKMAHEQTLASYRRTVLREISSFEPSGFITTEFPRASCHGNQDSWNSHRCVGVEVLTAVVMKNYYYRDITPCSPFEIQPTFRRNISTTSSRSKTVEQDTSVKADRSISTLKMEAIYHLGYNAV